MKQKTRSSYVLIPVVMPILAVLACAQDCMGVTFSVQGYVADEKNNPIFGAAIKVWNNGSFERSAFEFHVSNNDGYFETDSTFSYGCTPFQVEVSVEGFESKTLAFYPPAGEGWPTELPDEITIQLQTLPN
jgi:hypothetical protein